MANGTLHPAGGGLEGLRHHGIQHLGNGVDYVHIPHGNDDCLPQILVALDVGGDTNLVDDVCHHGLDAGFVHAARCRIPKALVSVRLAAQCTDARVNVVVEGLFAKYPTVEALAEADVNNIEEIVRPCGLGKSKARDISACMKMLRDEYGGKIPKDFNAILKLPGVGRKSANLIMGDVFGEPAIVTDTHCIRLVNRIGLVDGIKDPKKVEMELWKLVPPEEGSDFCHRLVYHGREVCTARTKPHCDRCCLADICKKVGVEK